MSDYRSAAELDGGKDSSGRDVKATSLAQKLKDLWWRICTSEGSIWNLPIVVWNDKGQAEPIKSTPAIELGYNKLNNKVLRDKLDLVLANQAKIIAKLGA